MRVSLRTLAVACLGYASALNFGQDNIDAEFNTGAGSARLLEAVLDEDWVNSDSRRMLQGVYAGSAILTPETEAETETEETDTSYNPPMLGGAKDEGGCYTSAGYTWCAAKNKCLRSWEEACEEPAVEEPVVETVTTGSPTKSAPMEEPVEEPVEEEMEYTELPAAETDSGFAMGSGVAGSGAAGSGMGFPSSDMEGFEWTGSGSAGLSGSGGLYGSGDE